MSNDQIPFKTIKKYRKAWNPASHKEIFAAYDAELRDRKSFRIYLPLVKTSSVDAPGEIVSLLKDQGYEVQDYVAGLAKQINGKRVMRIGVLLKHHHHWLKQFTNDPSRNAAKAKDLLVCISRHPLDIIRMSTGRGWDSCMNAINGCNKKYILQDVKRGSLIAYLINKEDKEIKKPIARILIKQFVSIADPDSIVLYPETQTYGTASMAFMLTVQEWVDKINNDKAGLFKLRTGLYNDGRAFVVKNFEAIAPDKQLDFLKKAKGEAVEQMFLKMENPSESAQLIAVRRGGHILKLIKNPSYRVKIAAIKKYGAAIEHIKNPTPRMQMMAVKQSYYSIEHIKNPCLDVQKYVLKAWSGAIRYIKNPGEDIQIEAVRVNPFALQYIKKPTEKVIFEALRSNGSSIQYVKRPTTEMKHVAIESSSYALGHIKKPTDELKLAAVTAHGAAIVHCENPSDALVLLALTKDGSLIHHFTSRWGHFYNRELTEEMKFAAVRSCPSALYYLADVQTEELCRAAIHEHPEAYEYCIAPMITEQLSMYFIECHPDKALRYIECPTPAMHAKAEELCLASGKTLEKPDTIHRSGQYPTHY